jgi:hypothetical protein
MTNRAWDTAVKIIRAQGGYARSRDLRAAGVHPVVLHAMERDGRVLHLERGLYTLANNTARDERREALLAVPGAVLCLGSALSFHELGTWEPPQILPLPAISLAYARSDNVSESI